MVQHPFLMYMRIMVCACMQVFVPMFRKFLPNDRCYDLQTWQIREALWYLRTSELWNCLVDIKVINKWSYISRLCEFFQNALTYTCEWKYCTCISSTCLYHVICHGSHLAQQVLPSGDGRLSSLLGVHLLDEACNLRWIEAKRQMLATS